DQRVDLGHRDPDRIVVVGAAARRGGRGVLGGRGGGGRRACRRRGGRGAAGGHGGDVQLALVGDPGERLVDRRARHAAGQGQVPGQVGLERIHLGERRQPPVHALHAHL